LRRWQDNIKTDLTKEDVRMGGGHNCNRFVSCETSFGITAVEPYGSTTIENFFSNKKGLQENRLLELNPVEWKGLWNPINKLINCVLFL
jgi:hypothetical protein